MGEQAEESEEENHENGELSPVTLRLFFWQIVFCAYCPIRIVSSILGKLARISGCHFSAKPLRGGKSPDLPFPG